MLVSPVLRTRQQLQEILQRQEVHFVGGCVRDLLLGRPLHDLDLAVAGDAVALARSVAHALRAAFVLLDEENGIARVVLRGPDGGPEGTIDLARQRGNDLQEDLAARDLTINAMAMDPPAFWASAAGEVAQPQVVDPFGGLEDLRAQRIRAVREQAFRDDPLRTLRVIRLAAELDFAVDPQTAGWVRQTAGLLPRVSWERIRDEVLRLLGCPHAAPYLSLLAELALLPYVLPEVESVRTDPGLGHLGETVCSLEWIAGRLADGGRPRSEGAFWQPAALASHPDLRLDLPYAVQVGRYLHTRLAGKHDRLALLKLAGLLHHGSGQEARRAGSRLRLSGGEVFDLASAVAHLEDALLLGEGETSRLAVYRFYRDTGAVANGVLLLSLAHELAIVGPSLQREPWSERVDHTGAILALHQERFAEVISPSRLVDGDDLMDALGLEPGPWIGRLLEGIREAQVAGEVRSREEALAWARCLLGRDE